MDCVPYKLCMFFVLALTLRVDNLLTTGLMVGKKAASSVFYLGFENFFQSFQTFYSVSQAFKNIIHYKLKIRPDLVNSSSTSPPQ